MTITASPGPRDARQAINGDGAFASCDQQDLFDLVSMLGDRFTAGKDVDQDSHGVRTAGPVHQMLQRRQPWPAPARDGRHGARDRRSPIHDPPAA